MKFISSNPERFGSKGKWKSTSVPSRHAVPINIDFLSVVSVTSAEVFATARSDVNSLGITGERGGEEEEEGPTRFLIFDRVLPRDKSTLDIRSMFISMFIPFRRLKNRSIPARSTTSRVYICCCFLSPSFLFLSFLFNPLRRLFQSWTKCSGIWKSLRLATPPSYTY